ncbi:hypothetical protein BDV93DRAFT_518810 [Ceratobasidium sp. AG-I]|nr:hypothetical protein BDV93DRAFT_518810 [Ceratobasidium sp. AG-I]
MSSESELTDISSEDYDSEPGAESSKKRKVKGPVYTIKNALNPPITAQYATEWLSKQMKSKDIKVDPEYQRDVVWSDIKQTKLVDSILRNFYIPPVPVTVDKAGNETRICIDGKQRLTSISRGLSYYFKQADSTKNCRLLPEMYRKQFRNKQIVCIEYRQLSQAYEREIFSRVQLGMALTTGEQLQAFDGPMTTFIHRMQNELFEDAQVDRLIGLSTDRGRGFQDLVQTVACIARLPGYTHATYQQQTKILQCQGMSPEDIKTVQDKSERVFGFLRDIAIKPRLCEVAFPLPNRTSRTSPVEFLFAALFIALSMDKPGISLDDMANGISDMRKSMRALHGEMRSNSKVALSFWNYLTKSLETLPRQPDSPTTKKSRINPPVTLQTPVHSPPTRISGATQTRLAKSRSKAEEMSDQAAQFNAVFMNNTSTQRPTSFNTELQDVKLRGQDIDMD